MSVVPFDPVVVAERGRKIYDRHRPRFEAECAGKFGIIDVNTERLFLGDSPESAYRQARDADQAGPFHVVRVGHSAVYRSTRPVGWRRLPAR